MARDGGSAIAWDAIDLVVFDVDGTLYHAARLRARMAAAIVAEVARSGNWRLPKALHAFRRHREALGDRQLDDFATLQYELPARTCGLPVDEIRRLTEEWIERRPLRHLRACRLSGIDRLFRALAASGKTIAIFSDYPAAEKMRALQLEADIIVSAVDSDVGWLKPDTAGLRKILRLADADPRRSVMIGDRADRDGEVARRLGMPALIRARRPDPASGRFRSYADALFEPLLRQAPAMPTGHAA